MQKFQNCCISEMIGADQSNISDISCRHCGKEYQKNKDTLCWDDIAKKEKEVKE